MCVVYVLKNIIDRQVQNENHKQNNSKTGNKFFCVEFDDGYGEIPSKQPQDTNPKACCAFCGVFFVIIVATRFGLKVFVVFYQSHEAGQMHK